MKLNSLPFRTEDRVDSDFKNGQYTIETENWINQSMHLYGFHINTPMSTESRNFLTTKEIFLSVMEQSTNILHKSHSLGFNALCHCISVNMLLAWAPVNLYCELPGNVARPMVKKSLQLMPLLKGHAGQKSYPFKHQSRKDHFWLPIIQIRNVNL